MKRTCGPFVLIGQMTLVTNDLKCGARFYDAVAALLDTPRMMEFETLTAWRAMDSAARVGLTMPFTSEPARLGDGVMVGELRDETLLRRPFPQSGRRQAQSVRDEGLHVTGRSEAWSA